MAAYAALVSLMNIMEQIQNHPRHSISFGKKQIESLQGKVGFLQDFLEGYSRGSSEEAEVLESDLASAAFAAEDVIESHIVDQIRIGSTEKSSISLLDLEKVLQDMDSVKEKVMKVKEERGYKEEQSTYSMSATSSRPLITGKSNMVGFDDYVIQLMDTLTGQKSCRQIIPIFGMGGIGKTTLAKNVYENLVIVQYFDIRAWVTVSQEYCVREILLELLSCLKLSTNEIDRETDDKLGERIYKSLSGRRYLVILDDIWSIEVWDKIKSFFPDNNVGSRIVVTTRLSNMAIHFGSSGLAMNFLDEDKSWSLFCEKAFAQEGCPPELEEIGKKIVKNCKGLPLSIVVIGGLLGKSYRTKDYWENIAKDVNLILNSGEDKQCLNIFSLSYSHLPVHLKPCFLYMGVFAEDEKICVSLLTKLWVAEGFLKANKAQSLEEVAEGYINDLVDRSLILVHRWSRNGKIKSCYIHDLLRDLCLRVAEKEKFLRIMRMPCIPRGLDREHRIVLYESILKKYQHRVFHALRSASLARSLLSEGDSPSFQFRLLRVLNAHNSDSLEATFQQVNLRYIAYEHVWIWNSELPSSISLLWNLQTLIIRGASKRFFAPSEIWHMPQLRHLQFYQLYLPHPQSDRLDQQDDFVLHNLQTLTTVVNVMWSEEVCKRIPNVKKLNILYDDFYETRSYYCLYNLGRLHKLESLNCSFDEAPNRGDLLQNLTFPSSLRKLSLRNCHLQWKDLTMIGSLPNLEVLKLDWFAFRGPEWSPVEGEFLRLKFLKVFSNELIYWNADRSHFPVLENLVLDRLWKLVEIPSGVGEIPTLRAIELRFCSESASISAMKILEEQENLGNEGLQVRVTILESNLESFKENVDLESFTSKYFQLQTY